MLLLSCHGNKQAGGGGDDDGGGGGDRGLTGARWARRKRKTRCREEYSWCGRLRPACRGCGEEGGGGSCSARLYPPPPELPRGPADSHQSHRIYCPGAASKNAHVDVSWEYCQLRI